MGGTQSMLTLVLRQSHRWLPILFFCLCLAVSSNGCHRTTPTENAEGRMRRLYNPLIDYLEITVREEKGPPTEEGFKAFVGSLSKQKKSDLGITDTQDVFV